MCGAGCHLSPLSARLEVGELPDDHMQQAGLCHAFNLDATIEAIEDGACCRKETLNEGLQLSPGVFRAPGNLLSSNSEVLWKLWPDRRKGSSAFEVLMHNTAVSLPFYLSRMSLA